MLAAPAAADGKAARSSDHTRRHSSTRFGHAAIARSSQRVNRAEGTVGVDAWCTTCVCTGVPDRRHVGPIQREEARQPNRRPARPDGLVAEQHHVGANGRRRYITGRADDLKERRPYTGKAVPPRPSKPHHSLTTSGSEITPGPPATTITQRPSTGRVTSIGKKANPISPTVAAAGIS